MNIQQLIVGIWICCTLSAFQAPEKQQDVPKIVNIVNFIRLLEPRDPKITQDVLYQTVVKQVEIMRKYRLGGTFLLQYDALMDKRYQALLSSLNRDSFEIGAWWELPQPLVEKAGLKCFIKDPSLGFNYTQAGQENSFTWDGMSKGFDIQMPLIARLRDEHKIRVETMEASGRWFRKKYKVTPVTSFSVDKDLEGIDLKTIWFNSRFYRINILWEHGTLRIRDIHLFNEKLPSVYETQPVTENECRFFTLPFVDGYIWSKPEQLAGLRLKAVVDGKEISLEGGDPKFTRTGPATMHISWPLQTIQGSVEIDLGEKKMEMKLKSNQAVKWFLDLNTVAGIQLPFGSITSRTINCNFEGMQYRISTGKGSFSKPANGPVLRIHPQSNSISLIF